MVSTTASRAEDMSGLINSLLQEISAASSTGFNVRRYGENSAYYVGRDAEGRACLLIQVQGAGRAVPLQLAGLEAHFALDCRVQEPGQSEETKTLSVIVCLSRTSSIEAYFSSIAESMIQILGPTPSADHVREAVDQFVQLFQKLQAPPRSSVTGMLGELCFIYFAADKDSALRAWRIDPDERFDFGAGNLRIDVKSSTQRQRLHDVSFDQANPPTGTRSLFASIWIEPAGGGTTFSTLLALIERAMTDKAAISKLHAVVANTLGASLPGAMSFRFDLRSAGDSLLFFDAKAIPALRPPLPAGLSGVRFVSNFGLAQHESPSHLKASLRPDEIALLPS